MQTLLPAIQARLERLDSLSKRQQAFVSPFENFMPTGSRPPCIGIVPGVVRRTELGGEAMEIELSVLLVGFVLLDNSGQWLVAEDGVYGLLDQAVEAVGKDQLTTEVTGLLWGRVGTDRRSELFVTENKLWIVKVVRELIYTKETEGTCTS
jgi:hypothetical protein